MSIYTKTGDSGMTSLYGGKRVSKSSTIINTLGEVDELNALLGIVRNFLVEEKFYQEQKLLHSIQANLFLIGSYIASVGGTYATLKQLELTDEQVELVESAINGYEQLLPKLTHFILPYSQFTAASYCYLARAVCRRAERSLVAMKNDQAFNSNIIRYLNRLSDLLFVLYRYLNLQQGQEEEIWQL